jgi:hypothetical protein
MKKLLFLSLVLTSTLLISCGDDKEAEEKKEATVCSCKKTLDKVGDEMEVETDYKKIKKKYASELRLCDKLQDEMGSKAFSDEMMMCE